MIFLLGSHKCHTPDVVSFIRGAFPLREWDTSSRPTSAEHAFLLLSHRLLLFSKDNRYEIDPKGLHPDRVAGGHRHHRRLDRLAAPRSAGGPRSRPAHPVHKQSQADG